MGGARAESLAERGEHVGGGAGGRERALGRTAELAAGDPSQVFAAVTWLLGQKVVEVDDHVARAHGDAGATRAREGEAEQGLVDRTEVLVVVVAVIEQCREHAQDGPVGHPWALAGGRPGLVPGAALEERELLGVEEAARAGRLGPPGLAAVQAAKPGEQGRPGVEALLHGRGAAFGVGPQARVHGREFARQASAVLGVVQEDEAQQRREQAIEDVPRGLAREVAEQSAAGGRVGGHKPVQEGLQGALGLFCAAIGGHARGAG